jgi:hypothetical protein
VIQLGYASASGCVSRALIQIIEKIRRSLIGSMSRRSSSSSNDRRAFANREDVWRDGLTMSLRCGRSALFECDRITEAKLVTSRACGKSRL